jgi:3-phenylpropionate/trans-cinnamate dioxygenase ferredoxin reductase component
MSERIVVVGASMGGLRAAEQLRGRGFTGEVIVIGDEAHLPYNRPPLSKDVLAQHRDDTNSGIDSWHRAVAFRQRKNTADVTWRLGQSVLASDLDAQTLSLADGTTVAFDGLVIATGLRPRRLNLAGPARGRHVIRSLDDAVALRTELRPGVTVVVVGGGFIGCETAATARKIGAAVHIVEPQAGLMIRPLGPALGRALQRVHHANGVTVHTGVGIAELTATVKDPDRLAGVVLTDGTTLVADVLIESVGSHPNTEWLEGNGLDLSNGVLCDNRMRVASRHGIVAVGDVARFPDPSTAGTARRVEHWCIPTDTAKRAAKTLLTDLAGEPEDTDVFCPLPAFWSDQYDLRLQGYGTPGDAETVRVLEGTLGEPGEEHAEAGAVVGYFRGDELIGVVMISPTSTQNLHYRNEIDTARAVLEPL